MKEPFIYFIGSQSVDILSHPVVQNWVKSRKEDSAVGAVFPDEQETRPGMAFETSLRKIDNCSAVIAIPKADGSFGESVTWEITYALHTGKSVGLGMNDGTVNAIYDISQLAYVTGSVG